jgi:GTPase
LVTDDVAKCYYIIGIEDSGVPSFLDDNELINSINFISQNLAKDKDLKFKYIYMHNNKLNYKFVIVKFWLNKEKNIEYFN